MKRIRNYLLTISLFIIVGCDSDVEPNVGKLEVNLDKAKILELVNQSRWEGAMCGSTAKESVPALKWNDKLAKAALDHSNDMYNNDYFSHTSPDGTNFSKRATNAGYEGRPMGENIAWGYSSEEAVMKGWMNSPGHCKNIMIGNATEIGVAKSDQGNYWTMVLGKE
ncbi:CAP domain-containing protein [Sediminitomix flava]|uniref:Cysteine-rich secretory protein family protein n=1 Tax=Sediminitomix flava TaxID=379075 RepID=A0A315Z8E3_SEDFL|nr:CAP domain-containing protein [Sediminitomix flava]PWJ40195.1 Cysteine-rich secretory protein family protein [Sediminitomix flava]